MADKSDRGIYILGGVLGVCAGVLDVKFGDLLLTALFVLMATMLLGALRPQRPWRWTLTGGRLRPPGSTGCLCVLTEKPYRAQIYESFLGFLTGIAGAYGGATARRGVGGIVEVRRAAFSSSAVSFQSVSPAPVILSAATASRREAATESKDPYT